MRGAGAEVENLSEKSELGTSGQEQWPAQIHLRATHLASRRIETKTAGQMKRKGQGNIP